MIWISLHIYLFYFFCPIRGLGSLYIDLLKAPFKGTGETVPAYDVYVAMIHVSDVRVFPLCSPGHVPYEC